MKISHQRSRYELERVAHDSRLAPEPSFITQALAVHVISLRVDHPRPLFYLEPNNGSNRFTEVRPNQLNNTNNPQSLLIINPLLLPVFSVIVNPNNATNSPPKSPHIRYAITSPHSACMYNQLCLNRLRKLVFSQIELVII